MDVPLAIKVNMLPLPPLVLLHVPYVPKVPFLLLTPLIITLVLLHVNYVLKGNSRILLVCLFVIIVLLENHLVHRVLLYVLTVQLGLFLLQIVLRALHALLVISSLSVDKVLVFLVV